MSWFVFIPGALVILILVTLLVMNFAIRRIRDEREELELMKKPCAHCLHSVLRRYE